MLTRALTQNMYAYAEQRYDSQKAYGVHGGLICTPVSTLVACQFMKQVPLTEHTVRQCMVLAHRLYNERFARKGHMMLMVEDLLTLFPPERRYQEVAGCVADTSHQWEVEGMKVKPLLALLEEMRHSRTRCAAVITMNSHTEAYMFEKDGGTWHVFDPLPASMRTYAAPVSIERVLGHLPEKLQYSGIIL